MDDIIVVLDLGIRDGAASLWVCGPESVRSKGNEDEYLHTRRDLRVMWWEHVVGSANDLEPCQCDVLQPDCLMITTHWADCCGGHID